MSKERIKTTASLARTDRICLAYDQSIKKGTNLHGHELTGM